MHGGIDSTIVRLSHLCLRIFKKLQRLERFSCHRDAFAVFAKQHPALLFPAFELQMRIISKCLGFRFWSHASLAHREMAEEHKTMMSIKQIRHIMTHRKGVKGAHINRRRPKVSNVSPGYAMEIPVSSTKEEGTLAFINIFPLYSYISCRYE